MGERERQAVRSEVWPGAASRRRFLSAVAAAAGPALAAIGLTPHPADTHKRRKRRHKRCRQRCQGNRRTCERGCDILDGDSKAFCKKGCKVADSQCRSDC